MLIAQTPRRSWMFDGLKAFSNRHSNQTTQAGPIDSDPTIPGKLLNGRYKITQALGVGGFSQTHLAKDIYRPSNPICVVKHFKPANRDRRFLQTAQHLFQVEAEILEKLGHHNQIPQLLAYFEEQQNFYLIEEYIDGHPLSEEMLLGHCWSESQVTQLLQEVLDLLVFIHSHSVLHRDIKPDNLIRRKLDNKLVLIDFGTIKQIRIQTVTPQGHRIATTPIGTQGYMAAEQGQGNPRPSSDLYALGIISIQALTGLDPTQLQQDPNTGEVSWQEQAKVSPELALIVTKLTSYHFKDRYQSAIEVLEALQPLKTQSNSPRHLYSQPESSAQTNFSMLLPESSEVDQEAVFLVDPSAQPIDSDAKSKRWIWTGVGTGLASAVALSAVISSIPDSPVQSAAKPNNLVQNMAKPNDSGNTPVKPASSTPRQREELAQTTNPRPMRTSSIPSRSESKLAREQPSSLPAEPGVTAAANPSAQPAKLQSGEQPSSRSTEKPRVILATTNPPTKEKLALEAEPTQKPDQSVKKTQDVSESSIDNRQAKLKMAELKMAFSKLAKAIALADKTLVQGQEVTEETFDYLGGVLTKMQQQVEIPSQKKGLAAPPTNSFDQQVLSSPDVKALPVKKHENEPTSNKQPDPLEEQSEKITPIDSSTNEQELPPTTSVEELAPSSNEAVVPAAESEKERGLTEEPIISTPTPSTSETMAEEELEEATPTTSTEKPSPKVISEEQPTEAIPTEELEEAVTPAVSTEASSEVTSEAEAVFEGKEDPTTATEEPLNSDTAVQEVETSDSEVVSEEQLEVETAPGNAPVISPDGQFLAGSSANHTIKIWNMQTGELVSVLKGSSGVQSIAFGSDSQTLTSTGADGTTTTWNL